MYKATTHAIQVTVEPQYLPDQSEPSKSQYVWSYKARIENKGDAAVQLRSRHWKITDGLGRLQEVKGPGVVGKRRCCVRARRSSTLRARRSRRHRASWAARTRWWTRRE